MNRRLIKVVSLILMVVLLTVSLVAGCSDEEEEAGYTITKTATALDTTGNGFIDNAGEIIEYTVEVENTSEATITGVGVSDSLITLERQADDPGNNNDDLEPGETWVYTGSYTAQQSDLDAGNIKNTATVSSDELGNKSATEEVTCGTTTVKLALLVPLSGPASAGYLPAVAWYEAYVDYLNDENPVPGVEFEVIKYDTMLGTEAAIPAYQWAKGQGAKFIAYADSTTTESLADTAEAEKFPIINVVGTAIASESDYVFNNTLEFNQYTAGFAKWLEETWDYTGMGRNPKVGAFGWNMSFGIDHAKGVKDYCEANPDKFDWIGSELAPYGTTTWSAEVNNLSTCDYIVVGAFAGGVSSFIKEFRDAGYDGKFVFDDASVSFINNVYLLVLTPDELEGSIWTSFNHYLSYDPSALGDILNDTVLPDYAGDQATLMASNPWASESFVIGGIAAMEAWRDAIAQLESDQEVSDIDGEILYNSLTSLHVDITGYPTIGWSTTSPILFNAIRVYTFDQNISDFLKLSDWITGIV